MFDSPVVRLICRSLLAGVTTFLGIVQASGYDSMDTAAWVNAGVAAGLAALAFSGISAVTPIDQSIGPTGSRGVGK